jgi:hypothetical protein
MLQERTLTRADLKGMGFGDPWPSETMAKLIPTKWGVVELLVYSYSSPGGIWYVYGGGDYYKEFLEELKEERCKYLDESRAHEPGIWNDRETHDYPRVYTKKDVEDICFKLTGKSIYEIDIKPDPKDKEEGMKFWNELQNFGKEKIKPKKRKSLFERIFSL